MNVIFQSIVPLFPRIKSPTKASISWAILNSAGKASWRITSLFSIPPIMQNQSHWPSPISNLMKVKSLPPITDMIAKTCTIMFIGHLRHPTTPVSIIPGVYHCSPQCLLFHGITLKSFVSLWTKLKILQTAWFICSLAVATQNIWCCTRIFYYYYYFLLKKFRYLLKHKGCNSCYQPEKPLCKRLQPSTNKVVFSQQVFMGLVRVSFFSQSSVGYNNVESIFELCSLIMMWV